MSSKIFFMLMAVAVAVGCRSKPQTYRVPERFHKLSAPAKMAARQVAPGVPEVLQKHAAKDGFGLNAGLECLTSNLCESPKLGDELTLRFTVQAWRAGNLKLSVPATPTFQVLDRSTDAESFSVEEAGVVELFFTVKVRAPSGVFTVTVSEDVDKADAPQMGQATWSFGQTQKHIPKTIHVK